MIIVCVSCLNKPVCNPRKMIIPPGDQSEPPGNDNGAPWMPGQLQDTLRDILGRDEEQVKPFWSASFPFDTATPGELCPRRAGIDTGNLDAKRGHFATQGCGKPAHPIFRSSINCVGRSGKPA